MREFIHDSLYHPKEGYFTRHNALGECGSAGGSSTGAALLQPAHAAATSVQPASPVCPATSSTLQSGSG